MKRLAVNLAVALAIAVPCWLVAEWVVAQAQLLEVSPAMSRGHPRRGYQPRAGFEGVTRYGVPIVINSLGLRSPEIEVPKPPGVRRVLMVGDSVTFAWGVPEEVSFSRRLEAVLREQLACPVEVVNAGVSGYNTVKELDYFANEGQLVEPDVVVVYQIENDNNITSPVRGRLAVAIKDWIAYRSYVVNASLYAVRVLRWRSEARAAGGDAEAYAAQQRAWGSQPGTAASLDAMREIAAIARERDIRAILAAHPNNLADPGIDVERNRLLRDLAAEEGMAFVDVTPALRGHPLDDLAVSATDRHPSALGHELIAGALLPAVRAALECPAATGTAGTED